MKAKKKYVRRMKRPQGLFIALGLFLSWPRDSLSNPDSNPSANPAERIADGKEEQRRGCALIFEKNRSKRCKACSDVVRVVGLEPTHQWYRNLNPARLPIPPYPHIHFQESHTAEFLPAACLIRSIAHSFLLNNKNFCVTIR